MHLLCLILLMSQPLKLMAQHSIPGSLSWITFIQMHNFPLEPNPDTLSFFIVYMSHHIHPKSVRSYLSSLIHKLEPNFPSVHKVCLICLVVKVMKRCMKSRGKAVRRKLPLVVLDLNFIKNRFSFSQSHDDLLFAALITTGFQIGRAHV